MHPLKHLCTLAALTGVQAVALPAAAEAGNLTNINVSKRQIEGIAVYPFSGCAATGVIYSMSNARSGCIPVTNKGSLSWYNRL